MSLFCIHSLIQSQLDIKKSNFLAFLCPANEFSLHMASLREQHPKARHFVYAYRQFNELGQLVENLSDDGEPKGSSGKPCLSVLRGADLVNTAVIVVRYFGGTKLGVGGLVRAYSDSVNDAIKEAKEQGVLVPYVVLSRLHLVIPFTHLAKVEHLLKNYHYLLIDRQFSENGVELTLDIADNQRDQFTSTFSKNLWGQIIE